MRPDTPTETDQPQPPLPPSGLSALLSHLPRPIRIGLPVLIVLGIIGMLVALQITGSDSSGQSGALAQYGPLDARPPQQGDPAPDFALQTLDGESVRLSAQRGKPVLVNFWATWCGPCKAEMPDIQAVYAAADGKLVVLAVNVEGTSAERARTLARDFRDLQGISFPILLDSPDGDVFEQYRLKGLPDSVFIDRNGVVQEMVIGPLSKEALKEKLERIMR